MVIDMYSALKRGDMSEYRRLKEKKGLSRRQRKRIKDEAIAKIVSSPLSNKMIEPDSLDVNALDCILEIGMLAKIFQAGLLARVFMRKLEMMYLSGMAWLSQSFL